MIIVSMTGELTASIRLILICSLNQRIEDFAVSPPLELLRVVSLDDADAHERALDLSQQHRRRSQRRPAGAAHLLAELPHHQTHQRGEKHDEQRQDRN